MYNGLDDVLVYRIFNYSIDHFIESFIIYKLLDYKLLTPTYFKLTTLELMIFSFLKFSIFCIFLIESFKLCRLSEVHYLPYFPFSMTYVSIV